MSLVFPLAFVTITVGRGVGSIVRQRGEGGSRRMPRQQQRPPLGGARAGHPKGKDGVERGARAGYTGERARSPSIVPSVPLVILVPWQIPLVTRMLLDDLGTRFFHSQGVWRLPESSLSGVKSPKEVRKKIGKTNVKIGKLKAPSRPTRAAPRLL